MRTAMIVDDALFMRMVVKNALEKMGVEVIAEAENGEVAIPTYQKSKPDFVLMDITMPVMNGIDALKEIVKIDPSAKIIMCSAMGQQTMVMDALKAGAKNFIIKPYHELALREAINKLFL